MNGLDTYLLAGCRDTVTFDRDLRGAPGYVVL